MTDAPPRTDADEGENPLERQRELMKLLSQETRHSIIQTLLGHPSHLASAAEINHFVANKSKKTVDEQLAMLVEADILSVYEYPPNRDRRGLPWKFFGFSEYGIDVLGDFNYLRGVPIARAVYQKTRTTEQIDRHQNAPRPPLATAVREAFRLDESEEEDAEMALESHQ